MQQQSSLGTARDYNNLDDPHSLLGRLQNIETSFRLDIRAKERTDWFYLCVCVVLCCAVVLCCVVLCCVVLCCVVLCVCVRERERERERETERDRERQRQRQRERERERVCFVCVCVCTHTRNFCTGCCSHFLIFCIKLNIMLLVLFHTFFVLYTDW